MVTLSFKFALAGQLSACHLYLNFGVSSLHKISFKKELGRHFKGTWTPFSWREEIQKIPLVGIQQEIIPAALHKKPAAQSRQLYERLLRRKKILSIKIIPVRIQVKLRVHYLIIFKKKGPHFSWVSNFTCASQDLCLLSYYLVAIERFKGAPEVEIG